MINYRKREGNVLDNWCLCEVCIAGLIRQYGYARVLSDTLERGFDVEETMPGIIYNNWKVDGFRI